jgi:hypothetical protein
MHSLKSTRPTCMQCSYIPPSTLPSCLSLLHFFSLPCFPILFFSLSFRLHLPCFPTLLLSSREYGPNNLAQITSVATPTMYRGHQRRSLALRLHHRDQGGIYITIYLSRLQFSQPRPHSLSNFMTLTTDHKIFPGFAPSDIVFDSGLDGQRLRFYFREAL